VSSREHRVFTEVSELVTGSWPTPLVRLKSLGDDVWAKLEFYNPLSRSVKDRTVWFMLRRAMERGELRDTIEEASSGNVAIALASLANMLGVKFRAYGPRYLPRVTEVILRVLGAEVVRLERDAIDEEFWSWVRKHAESTGTTNLDQFENPDNPEAHYEITGPEIVEQFRHVGRKPSVLIAGLGTGGHITGIARRLREVYGDIRVVGVEPERGSFIPGIKRVEYGTHWFSEVVDEVVDVSLEDAVDGVIRIARSEGLLVGLSSGAVVVAYERVRNRLGNLTYLLILPDDLFKYIDIIENFLD
jgi:cysteine synthase A